MPWKKTDTGIVHFVSNKAGLWAEIVSEEIQVSTLQLLEWAEFGGVYLNDSRISENCEIKDQDYLRIHTDPRRYPRISLTNRIALETDELLIVNKPAGLPCHPTVDNLKENLWFDLEKQFGKNFYPTHRLDVPTSGLIVLTKTPEAQTRFQNLLKDKKVFKIYSALVAAPGPELGLHEHYMEKSRYAPKTIHDVHRPHTQICQLKILEKKIIGDHTQLKIELITGRTHQIRAQLAFLGFPILEDKLYSDFESREQLDAIKLKCVYLKFPWRDTEVSCQLNDEIE